MQFQLGTLNMSPVRQVFPLLILSKYLRAFWWPVLSDFITLSYIWGETCCDLSFTLRFVIFPIEIYWVIGIAQGANLLSIFSVIFLSNGNRKLRLSLIQWPKVCLGTANYDIIECVSNNILGCIFSHRLLQWSIWSRLVFIVWTKLQLQWAITQQIVTDYRVTSRRGRTSRWVQVGWSIQEWTKYSSLRNYRVVGGSFSSFWEKTTPPIRRAFNYHKISIQ